MGFLFSLIPLNAIPLLLVILKEQNIIKMNSAVSSYEFLAIIAGMLIFTLSIELIKASMFAPKGANTWVDFMMSMFLFIGIISYLVYQVTLTGKLPSILYILVLEAQFFDLLVGFYITISNARRDFNTGG